MLEKLYNTKPLSILREVLQQEPSLLFEELWDSPKALLAYLVSEVTSKNVVIIHPESRYDRLIQDFAFFSKEEITEIPSWETLPSEEIPPSPDIVGKRFEALYKLTSRKKRGLTLVSLQTLLQKVVPPKRVQKLCFKWKVGDEVAFDALPHFLESLGFKRRPIAADKGEYAVRGGILDLFPLSSYDPYRIEFFGDTIEQIRTYDPIGQKSTGKVQEIFVSPADELNLLKEEKELSFLTDYFDQNTVYIFDDLAGLEDRYFSLKKLFAESHTLLIKFEDLWDRIKSHQTIFWSKESIEELSSIEVVKKTGSSFYSMKDPLQPLSFEWINETFSTKKIFNPFVENVDILTPFENQAAANKEEILHGLSEKISTLNEVYLSYDKESEKDTLTTLLSSFQLKNHPKIHFIQGYLSSGFFLQGAEISILSYPELTKRYKTRRQKWRNTYHTPAAEFHELNPGDLVVHFHNGIGKFLGIEKTKNHLGSDAEFLVLEYAQSSKLFVPFSQSHLVSRYIGAQEEAPPLHTLGTKKWLNTKIQAQQAIVGYAKQLLEMSAERTVKGGHLFPEDGEELLSFESDFPFEETQDQLLAVEEIKKDMRSSKAMDRLICGDVGYGKTEVAMRAAFKAVADGKKQVAVLVPTTVLAMQHYENFCERMANYPINIGVVSRFKKPKEIKDTIEKAKEGKIDILIGTHRLVSKDIEFKNLGLIIIDEEQRFGVRVKEHLKNVTVGVDCLTLSATPIPRTLYMSLIGARDISVINTPPQDRLPIKTILCQKDSLLIKNALMRELSRDGQAYYIHNRVDTIFNVADQLKKLVPEARVIVGHGQMSAEELDSVFHSFKSGNADILIATTIIESGIDIPNANTILIERADCFGLADLYQLRGRVGRWNRPAYAYFMTAPNSPLQEVSRKRLSALVEASGHGGGMKIALRDLEIRGAGDLLGTRQSGQVSAIGFHLYCKLLRKTIEAMKSNTQPSFFETKLEFPYDATLPESYVNETSLRLELYHRFGEASTLEEVDTLYEELKDRFGPPPLQVEWLYHLMRLRVFANTHFFSLIKIEKLTFTAERLKGNSSEKKLLVLPKTKSPAELTQGILEALKKSFKIT